MKKFATKGWPRGNLINLPRPLGLSEEDAANILKTAAVVALAVAAVVWGVVLGKFLL